MDKVYRAYEVNSRINFNYKDNGIAQLILSLSSLILVWILLSRIGIYGIFFAFIVGFSLAALYLFKQVDLKFSWDISAKNVFSYVKKSFPLALVIYSIEFFHALALTILAFFWDKESLGYFTFAFRIFQICLGIFPYLIQEVVRTRMYYSVANQKEEGGGLGEITFIMGAYVFIVTIFWILVYWWIDAVVVKFAPLYVDSIVALKILTLAILPLGICKILSDYLCSDVHKKTFFVVRVWFIGLLIQGVLLLTIPMTQSSLLIVGPIVYLIATFVVFYLIGTKGLSLNTGISEGVLKLTYLLLPLVVANGVLHIMDRYFYTDPSIVFRENMLPCTISIACFMVLFIGIVNLFKSNNKLRGFFSPVKS